MLRTMFFSAALAAVTGAPGTTAEPIDIGSRRELLVDDYLIDSTSGEVRLGLHRPVRREIVFETDAPWEGNASGYQSVFQDGERYRMYDDPASRTAIEGHASHRQGRQPLGRISARSEDHLPLTSQPRLRLVYSAHWEYNTL